MQYSIFFLFLLQAFASAAQSQLIPYRNGDKWGYCNNQKQILIACKFDSVDFFNDCNLAFVKVKEKYGYIDANGKMVIPPKYDSGTPFFQGNNNWDCINKVLLKGKPVWIDNHGHKIKPGELPRIMAICGFRGARGVNQTVFIQNGKKGLQTELYTKWGKIPRDSIILPAIYDELIFDDEALVYMVMLNGKWGLISSEDLKPILPFEYESIQPVYPNLLFIKQHGLFGLADKTGSILIPAKYQNNIHIIIGKNLVKVQTLDGKTGFVAYGGTEYFEN
jgi:hypothetical protein